MTVEDGGQKKRTLVNAWGFPVVETSWLARANSTLSQSQGVGPVQEVKSESKEVQRSSNLDGPNNGRKLQTIIDDVDYAVGGDLFGRVQIGDESTPDNPLIEGGNAVASRNTLILSAKLGIRASRSYVWLSRRGGETQ